ncbi:LOW QUALITY PROTEIN: coiled-coil domain-containing protein 130 homolog [Bradysia coprophila]|uniref:LOW QUALITY PROTEIN: coiled-coil domain-containing protein 130 homolog n=1 Tax=Bradysia coprophila TaxID=38358 RepID=UPI00187DC7AE|nr:LOW QUALITY PROTEIN: coiled-coil domain-containing protein 130 homolog [Bradysia coprophila]
MGERKGQNKYYPPDYNPKVGGLNKFLGTHALRERARKIHLGIIIIRFEMPYNIWCEGCKNHIGMGVRYNAEKTKIGMYYSTPIQQFRMKCHLCDNYIVIKTDPGNLDYVIVSGARRQENRWDPTENEQIVPDDKNVQKKLFDDPMFKLEHVVSDLKTSDDAKPRLRQLYQRNDTTWSDNYEANSRLRATFRARKKELKLSEEEDKKLLARCSLDINLLPESEQDRNMAALMRLQSAKTIAEREKEKMSDIMNRPALPCETTKPSANKRQKLMTCKFDGNNLGIVKKGDKNKTAAIGATGPVATVVAETSSQIGGEDSGHKKDDAAGSSNISLVSSVYFNSESDDSSS